LGRSTWHHRPEEGSRRILGPAALIPARIFQPGEGVLPALLFGCWVLGDIEISDKACQRLAKGRLPCRLG
jgi:acetyl esterase/lipase